MWAVRAHTEQPAGMGPITALPPPIHNRDVNHKTDLGLGRKGSIIMWWWQVYWSIMRLVSRRRQIDSHARRVKACVRAGLGPSRYKHQVCDWETCEKLQRTGRMLMVRWKCWFRIWAWNLDSSGAEGSFSHNVHQSESKLPLRTQSYILTRLITEGDYCDMKSVHSRITHIKKCRSRPWTLNWTRSSHGQWFMDIAPDVREWS